MVSSNRLTREGLAELLRQGTGVDVEALGPETLSKSVLAPDNARQIIVLDHGADRDLLMQLTMWVRRARPGADIIVTGVVGRESIGALVDAGVRAFAMRGASPGELIATIGTLTVERPIRQVPSWIGVQNPRDDDRPQPSPVAEKVLLTQREQQVVELIVDGMCNKEIAATLGVAIHTVKSHVHNILQKLAVGSRLALAALVRQQGSPWKAMRPPIIASDASSKA